MVRLKLALAVCLCGTTWAMADAVSGIGCKVGLAGGSMEPDQGTLASGSLCLPVTPGLGFQADGLYTRVSDRDFWGTSGHLFWRNPNKGLIGLVGGAVHEEGIDALQGGLEAEYYLPALTLGVRAGVAHLRYDGGALPFIDTDLTKPFADVELAYYPIDNLMVSGSAGVVYDNALVRGHAEWLTGFHGMALYADAAVGENKYDHVLIGLRWHFGGAKSLKAHHREDDPRDFASSILYGIGTYGAEFNRNARDYVRSHPASSGGSVTGSGDTSGGAGYGVIYYNSSHGYGVIDTTPSTSAGLASTEP
jgi:hypothetical protein